MNIRDIGGAGSTPDPQRFETENMHVDHANEQIYREEIPEPEEHGDEYIRSLTNTIKGTLYDVHDVRRDRIQQIRSQIYDEKYNPSGEKIAEKIVDILLPMGIKTLSVYKKLK